MKKMKRRKRWPRADLVRRVVDHLEDLGMSVYGNNYDPKDGWVGPPCRDYDTKTILQYREHKRLGKLWESEELQ